MNFIPNLTHVFVEKMKTEQHSFEIHTVGTDKMAFLKQKRDLERPNGIYSKEKCCSIVRPNDKYPS